MSNCGKLFQPHGWMSAFHYFKLGTPRQSLPCMGPENVQTKIAHQATKQFFLFCNKKTYLMGSHMFACCKKHRRGLMMNI